jgi:hypothetical protein
MEWAPTYHRPREAVNENLLPRKLDSLSASVHAATTATAATWPADALEAITAVDRSIAARLERHLGGLTTAAAHDVEHLAFDAGATAETAAVAATTALALTAAQGAARAATLGLCEAARGVEFLVVAAEQEFLSTVRAGKSLVC